MPSWAFITIVLPTSILYTSSLGTGDLADKLSGLPHRGYCVAQTLWVFLSFIIRSPLRNPSLESPAQDALF